MIRIKRPTTIPKILTSKATKSATNALIAQYQVDPNNPLMFDKLIYTHPDVKSSLRVAQHGKCAFCESIVCAVDDGDIEHFRPKAGCQQDLNNTTMMKPGYFWLAYVWENLLFACVMCNRRNKRNWFPLTNPSTRATPQNRSIKKERPLFIDPSAVNPRRFIRFREYIAYSINDNSTGKATIHGLGLNRQGPEPKGLLELRRDYFQDLKRDWRLFCKAQQLSSTMPSPEVQKILGILKKRLASKRSAKAPYSAMARDYLISVDFLAK